MQPTTRNTIELHRKFVRLRKIIREWKGNRVGNLTTQKKTSNEILQWLDRTWESRQLTSLEKLTIELVINRLEVIGWKKNCGDKERNEHGFIRATETRLISMR
jgi:hypothetical protein